MPDVLGYVADGGTAVLLQHPDPSEEIPEDVLKAFGIDSIGGEIVAPGVHFLTNIVIGLKDASFENGTDYVTEARDLTLAKDAEVEVESVTGVPLLWGHAFGDGRIYGYNGTERVDKTNGGLLAAMIAHCGADSIYPVVGIKLFFLDDSPRRHQVAIFHAFTKRRGFRRRSSTARNGGRGCSRMRSSMTSSTRA